MNSEYLFEKKGSDPDIERMEDLLSAYRIEPVAPALATIFETEDIRDHVPELLTLKHEVRHHLMRRSQSDRAVLGAERACLVGVPG